MGFLKKMGLGIMDWYGKFEVQGSSEKLRVFKVAHPHHALSHFR